MQNLKETIMKHNSYKAFTLSEVLITLVVIGIIAALTIPSIIQNTQDKEYDAARKKVLYTIGQAGRTMAVNGTLTYASNAEDFVENYFSRYVKIAKLCGINNVDECGLSEEITTMDGNPISMPSTIEDLANNIIQEGFGNNSATSYSFTLVNGYAIKLFYNPQCKKASKYGQYGQTRVCLNAIYDMNGLKKPNKVGKDIGFVTIISPDITSVAIAPKVYEKDGESAVFDNIGAKCDSSKNLFVPTVEELLSMFYNNKLIGNLRDNTHYWSSSVFSSIYGWHVNFRNGYNDLADRDESYPVRCVYK